MSEDVKKIPRRVLEPFSNGRGSWMLNSRFLLFFLFFLFSRVSSLLRNVVCSKNNNRNRRVEEDTGTTNYQSLALSIDYLSFFLSVAKRHYSHARLGCLVRGSSLEISFSIVWWTIREHRALRVESSSSSDIRQYKSESQYVNVLLSATFRCHDRGESISIRY